MRKTTKDGERKRRRRRKRSLIKTFAKGDKAVEELCVCCLVEREGKRVE